MALFVQVRIGAGFVSPARRLEPRVAALVNGFADGVTLPVLVALLLPWVLA